jgi:hypothetical protein
MSTLYGQPCTSGLEMSLPVLGNQSWHVMITWHPLASSDWFPRSSWHPYRHVSEPGMVTIVVIIPSMFLSSKYHSIWSFLIPDGICGPTHHHVQKGCSIKIVHDDKSLKNTWSLLKLQSILNRHHLHSGN